MHNGRLTTESRAFARFSWARFTGAGFFGMGGRSGIR